MTKSTEQKIKAILTESIDRAFEEPEFEDFNCWYGDNMAVRMADAAFSVLAATKEAQELMAREKVDPFGV